jgi:hypothetical protein
MKFKAANEGMGERGSDGNLAVSPTPRFADSFPLTWLSLA